MNAFRRKQLAYSCASCCHADGAAGVLPTGRVELQEIRRSMSITCRSNSNPDLGVIDNMMVNFTESELVTVIQGSIIHIYISITWITAHKLISCYTTLGSTIPLGAPSIPSAT